MADGFAEEMEARVQDAFGEREILGGGTTANSDGNRMAGHYWLRNPDLLPKGAIRGEIEAAIDQVRSFAGDGHSGRIQGQAGIIRDSLLIGIAGAACELQFPVHSIGNPCTDEIKPFFFDNADPYGMYRALQTTGHELNQTLCIVGFKSGATETRNGMLNAQPPEYDAGLNFGIQLEAITHQDSELAYFATEESWIEWLQMWDLAKGRTSESLVV